MKQYPFGIKVQTYRLGEDYVFHITGGQAHIGAVATAYPANGTIQVDLITVPGHREDELAVECARLACEKYNKTVTVVAGIHIDQATKEDIKTAVQSVREAMQEVLNRNFDAV